MSRATRWGVLLGTTALVGSIIAIGPAGVARAASSVVVVRPSSMHGWSVADDNGNGSGSGSFVTGPATPPAGSGSARLQVSAANAGWVLAGATDLAGTPLASLSELSYDTYRASADAGDNLAISLAINVDYDLTDAFAGWQGRLVFEPYLTNGGQVTQGIWQHWDALAGTWWQSGNATVGNAGVGKACPQAAPCTWAQVLAAYPHAGIHATLGALNLKAGSGWSSFDGNVDHLTVGVGANSTTYDFEPETPCTTTCYVSSTTGDDSFGGGTPSSAKRTIQAAIDAVAAGGQVRVLPGSYHETAANRTPSTIAGTYQFGLFFGAAKPGVSLIGVTAADVPITDATQTQATITTNATNNFGTDGIFVEAADTTIQGVEIGPNDSGDNKTIEVVADGFTLRDSATSIPGGGGSIYIDDFSPNGDVVKSYHVVDNAFLDGTSVDIASGAGNTGPVSGRTIIGNTFDLQDNGFNAISFNGSGGVAWFVNPVGGAIITGNSFAHSTQYIRARGVYAEAEFDWASYWNDNTFDRAAVALVTTSPFDVRSYAYSAFTNVRRIGGTIQGEVDDAATGDTVLAKAGTYLESVSVTKPLTIRGAGVGATTLQGTGAATSSATGIGIASTVSGVTVTDLTVTGFLDGVGLVPGGGTQDHLAFTRVAATNNGRHGLFLPAAALTAVTLDHVTSSGNGLVGSSGRGVYFTDGTKTDVAITNGVFDGNRLVGIDLNDGSATGVTVTGNEVIGNGDSGIGVLGAKGPGANLIAGNTVTDNGRFGIELKNSTGNGQASGPGSVVISGNTVTRTTAATDARDHAGIAVFRRAPGALNADQPSGAVVTGNTVSGYHRKPAGSTGDGFGIVVEGLGEVVTANVVSDNDVDIQIQANNTANTQSTAFFDRGDASASSAVIHGNRILTSGLYDLRNVGAPVTDATCNAFDSAAGPLPAKVFGGFVTSPFYLSANTAVPCGAPGTPSATAGDAQAVVSWTAPQPDSGPAPTGYLVTASPGGATCTTSGVLTCTVTGLVNDTAYTFTVRATDAAGAGAPSAPSNAVTPRAPVVVPGAPSAPLGVSGSPGDGQVIVSWLAPADAGTSPINGYVVTAVPGGATCSTTGALGCTVTGLSNGTPYTFTVRASNAVGAGPASAPSAPVTPLLVASGGPVGSPDFNPVGPQRVFDTRAGQSPDALRQVAKAKVGGATVLEVKMTDLPGFVPAVGVGAVSLNVAVTNPAADGFLTAYPCGPRELVASVNFLAGQTVSNAVIVPVSATGTVCFYSLVPTDVVVDVNGWFTAGGGFKGVTPSRVFDTRPGNSPDALVDVVKAPVTSGNPLRVKVAGIGGLPASGVGAVSLNVAVSGPQAAGFVTVYPCAAHDLVANLNFVKGQTTSNAVIATVSADGEICLSSSVTTDLVVDLNGWFTTTSDFHGVSPARVFDTRPGESPNAVRTVAKVKVGGDTIVEVQMTDITGKVPASGVNAVSLNVAVTNPAADGFVTAYPCGTRNLVASVNYRAGQTVSNAVLVPVSATGKVCFYSLVPTDVVVDLNGWFALPPG